MEYHTDHLGSTRLITDGYDLKVSEHEFYPFGQERSAYNQEVTTYNRSSVDPMKYTGHERDFFGSLSIDRADFLYSMHARMYHPVMGRFLSVDPVIDVKAALVNPQRWNRYAYVSNNPINKVDPDGKDELILMDQLQREQNALADGLMTRGQYVDIQRGRFSAGMIGLAEIAGVGAYYGAVRALAQMPVQRSIENPTSFTGARPEELQQSIPKNWGEGEPTSKGGGTRWFQPGTNRSNGVRIMPGTPGARDPLHAGPYAVFTRNGVESRIPLAGNPTLQPQSLLTRIIDSLERLIK